MSVRNVRLLHVEDDAGQRQLVAAHLGRLADFRFDIAHAASEREAVAAAATGFDCVLLDYQLEGGNGMSCLRRLRERDGITPIIVLSGLASAAVAAELLEAGADDYLAKEGLQCDTLGRCVRAAIARADALRNYAAELDPELVTTLESRFRGLCDEFAERLGRPFLARLDDLETDARKARLSMAQMLRFFDSACESLERAPERRAVLKRLLRPVMFEVVFRLFDESPARAAAR